MPILDLKDFKAAIAPTKRILAVDHGTKTLGLATSDESFMVATPLKTIGRTKFSKDLIAFKQVITDHDIGGIILGLPLNMDGSEGPRCQSVRQFAETWKRGLMQRSRLVFGTNAFQHPPLNAF